MASAPRPLATDPRTPRVSVIVPAYNEAENMAPLLKELARVATREYEVIIVDDGSCDDTRQNAQELTREYPFLRVVGYDRNQGKTEAIVFGAKVAQGDIFVVFDADLQFAVEDIPRLVERIEQGADMCVGYKQGRYEKRFVSSIYNRLAQTIFGLKVRDINAVKAFRREVLDSMSLRKDWHRYLVPLAADKGFEIAEIPVRLYPRKFGEPKYQAKSRILIGFFDLVAVWFQLTFMRKPMLYFGIMGMVSAGLGVLVGIVAIILRILGHGFRPLLYLVILLVLAGLMLFALGFLGEMLAGMSDRLARLEQGHSKSADFRESGKPKDGQNR